MIAANQNFTGDRNISFEALCQIIDYFENTEDELNNREKILSIIWNPIALVYYLVLVCYLVLLNSFGINTECLGIATDFLKAELFGSTITWSSVILLLLATIPLLFNIRPSQIRLIYNKCLSIFLKQTYNKILAKKFV
ncbi:hypothetical protein Ple7327_0499 [Pleurocapsa sp. PCC 7327]|nr:hypothetical protein Ple7327_0499 [Pleurocapsa sp. PCC 7327]